MENLKKAFKELIDKLALEFMVAGTLKQKIKELEKESNLEYCLNILPSGFFRVEGLDNTIVYKDGYFACSFTVGALCQVAYRVIYQQKTYREAINRPNYIMRGWNSETIQRSILSNVKEIEGLNEKLKDIEAKKKAFLKRKKDLRDSIEYGLEDRGLKKDYINIPE